MLKLLVYIPAIAFGFFSNAQGPLPYDPTDDLFIAFGSRCAGRGPFNAMAHSDAKGLQQIVSMIASDKTCNGLTDAIRDLQALAIANVEHERRAKEEIDYLANVVGQTELLLQQEMAKPAPFIDDLIYLKTELQSQRLNLIKSQTKPQYDRLYRRIDRVNVYHEYSRNLLSRMRMSDKCLTNHPNLSAQIGAQMIGLSSAFAHGLAGSLLFAVGSALDNLVSYWRDRNINENFKQITHARLGEAIGCSFEALSTTYCQSRDTLALIDFHDKKSQLTNKELPFWANGIDVIAREEIAFNEWLISIDGGTPPTTPGRFSDKKSVVELEAILKSTRLALEASFYDGKQLVNSSADKKAATRDVLNRLASHFIRMCGPNNPCDGPFSLFFAESPTCGPYIYFYSKGVERKPNADIQNCLVYVNNRFPEPPDLFTEVEPQMKVVLNDATGFITGLKSRALISMPQLSLNRVNDLGEHRQSAFDYMVAAQRFLAGLLKDPRSIAKRNNQRILIEDIKRRLEEVIIELERTEDPAEGTRQAGMYLGKGVQFSATATPAAPDPRKKLEKISELFIPVGDTAAIPTAIENILRQEIDNRIAMGEVDEGLAVVLELSKNSGLPELIRIYMGLEKARSQIDNSQELSRENLSAFGKVFSSSLKIRLERLATRAKNDSQAARSLGRLCAQAVAVPEAPRLNDLNLDDYCIGSQLTALASSGGQTLTYNNLKNEPEETRFCAVYDFYRKAQQNRLHPPRSSNRN